MPTNATIARGLAAAFVAGAIEVDGLVDRGGVLLGRRWPWLTPLARRVCAAFEFGPRPRGIAVARFLQADRGFLRACRRYELKLVDRSAGPAVMIPIIAASAWNLPAIRTAGELAEWLGVSLGQLDWFADRRGLEAKQGNDRLRHYHYRPLAKRFGQVRLIEAPKPRLKEIQRRILVEILDRVPAHSAAHGFRRGRSVKTFAAPHVDRRVVLRIDLENFFPSIAASRVQALFRSLGYPDAVADLLTGLCTNTTPADVWDECQVSRAATSLRDVRFLYSRAHLPQGTPTSPALANLCAYRLDCRLSALALSAGAVYTRYADDLAFSGDEAFCRVVKRFQLHGCATAMEEGFRVNHRKTRIMRDGVRQRLAGVIVNKRLNVARSEYDTLKATLTNCIRGGAAGQNRDGREDFRGHLLGKISYVAMLNAARGEKLRKLFERIGW